MHRYHELIKLKKSLQLEGQSAIVRKQFNFLCLQATSTPSKHMVFLTKINLATVQ